MDIHLRKRLTQYIYDPKLLESYLVSSVNITYKEAGKEVIEHLGNPQENRKGISFNRQESLSIHN